MIRGIYTSASGMTTQIKKQNSIANNLANVNTTAFKKSNTIMEQGNEMELYRKDNKIDNLSKKPVGDLTPIGKLGTGVKVAKNHINFSQAVILPSESSLDFAIKGEGFFLFETDKGLRFGRNGKLTKDKDGYLVNSNRDKILGFDFEGNLGYIRTEDKEPELSNNGNLQNTTLDTNVNVNGVPENFAVNTNGAINFGTNILIVSIDDTDKLIPEGTSYYKIENVNNLEVANSSELMQNHLESSDVNVVKEMVEMINCSRSYETNQKILTSQNDSLNKVVNEIGKWT